MPSETIDFKSFSSSLYSSEDICSSKEVSSRFILYIFHFEHGIRGICKILEIQTMLAVSVLFIPVFTFSWQRQASLWKSDNMPNCYG